MNCKYKTVFLLDKTFFENILLFSYPFLFLGCIINEPWSTVKEYLTVQNEGEREVSRIVKHYKNGFVNYDNITPKRKKITYHCITKFLSC